MSTLEVRFLGSGDAFGSGGRFQTCLLLRSRDRSVVLDFGSSSLIAMRRCGIEPGEVDVVLLTHLHGDHFGGIPFLVLQQQFRHRNRPLFVAGPSGTGERLRQAMEVLFPGSSSARREFSVEASELPERAAISVGPVSVTAFPVVHPSGAPAYALRCEIEGKVVTYSGDTEWTDVLAEAASGADLFVCEAYTFAKPVKYHLSYRVLIENRHRLACRRLILTHMSEDMLAHVGEVEAECAEDGMVVVL